MTLTEELHPSSRSELEAILDGSRRSRTPFALVHRPERHESDGVDFLSGEVVTADTIDDIPVPGDGEEALVLIPYRQIQERGYDCRDDGEPILVLQPRHRSSVSRADVVRHVPDAPVTFDDDGYRPSDAEYSRIVERVLREEIDEGSGANFVVHRSFDARLDGDPVQAALAVFGSLLADERGTYWTFLVHTGDRTFVGATPERHISLVDGTLTMSPISGTLRHPEGAVEPAAVREFLADTKETDELFMVVDEELKVMSRLCEPGVRVIGPSLRTMGRVSHTEYRLEGHCEADVRSILRESMFAPTVTGSPVENATRVIARHETDARGYYSGAIALIGRDETGRTQLDSAIAIRTADIRDDGRLRLGVGATLVRASDPAKEVLETRAKAEGLLSAMQGRATPTGVTAATDTAPDTAPDTERPAIPDLRSRLVQRNIGLSRYWLRTTDEAPPESRPATLRGLRVLVVDAEDDFTSMLAHLLASHGADATIQAVAATELADLDRADVVVMGPGPGDPRDRDDPKIAALAGMISHLLGGETPFVAICLSHQVLCDALGLPLVRLDHPHQGKQSSIDFFGRSHLVGFYNSFVAHSEAHRLQDGAPTGSVEISRDPSTGHVHGLRGRRFASAQFHPESILTRHGYRLVGELVEQAVGSGGPRPTGRRS